MKGGLVIGKRGEGATEEIQVLSDEGHNIVLGGTGSGKTRRMVIPTICATGLAGDSMILSDPKGELYDYTAPFLRSLGYQVIVLDFREPKKSQRFNFLQNVIDRVKEGDIGRAVESAWDIVSTLVDKDLKAKQEEAIWRDGKSAVLAMGILAVVLENIDHPEYQNMGNVYTFIAEMGKMRESAEDKKKASYYTCLERYVETLPADHPIRPLAQIAEIAPSKTRASFYASALTAIHKFSDINIRLMTQWTDFDIDSIGREKSALFILLPDEKTTYYPLASLIVSQLYERLVRSADKKGGRLDKTVFFNLDEFGNFTVISDFAAKITVSRSRGIFFNLIIQSFAQLEEKYGAEVAKIIRGNCEHLLYLKSNDKSTLKEISEMLGNYTTYSHSLNQDGREVDVKSQSINLIGRALLTPEEIKGIESPEVLYVASNGQAILHCPNLQEWSFNKLLGLGDVEWNRQLRERRNKVREEREEKEFPIWEIWKKFLD